MNYKLITNNAPTYMTLGFILVTRNSHNIYNPCMVKLLNMEFKKVNKVNTWIQDLRGKCKEMVKIMTNHHMHLKKFSKIEKFKVAKTQHVSKSLT